MHSEMVGPEYSNFKNHKLPRQAYVRTTMALSLLLTATQCKYYTEGVVTGWNANRVSVPLGPQGTSTG